MNNETLQAKEGHILNEAVQASDAISQGATATPAVSITATATPTIATATPAVSNAADRQSLPSFETLMNSIRSKTPLMSSKPTPAITATPTIGAATIAVSNAADRQPLPSFETLKNYIRGKAPLMTSKPTPTGTTTAFQRMTSFGTNQNHLNVPSEEAPHGMTSTSSMCSKRKSLFKPSEAPSSKRRGSSVDGLENRLGPITVQRSPELFRKEGCKSLKEKAGQAPIIAPGQTVAPAPKYAPETQIPGFELSALSSARDNKKNEQERYYELLL